MTLAVHALALAAALLPVPGTSDFNGDGLADVAQGGNPAGFTQQVKPPWSEYVVFGKGDGAFVDVRAPGTRGAIVRGPYSNYGNAPSVGDVNGDGLADLFVYDRIVLGQRGSGDEAGTGFTIRGGERAMPDSVLGAGDVNGDGIDDLVAFDGQYNGGITPKHRTLHLVVGAARCAT
jgi:FG-GAP-like repeat